VASDTNQEAEIQATPSESQVQEVVNDAVESPEIELEQQLEKVEDNMKPVKKVAAPQTNVKQRK